MNRRATLVADARAIVDAAEAEERELTAEETARVAALWAEVDRLEPASGVPYEVDCEWTPPS
jgi:hypothetical protein